MSGLGIGVAAPPAVTLEADSFSPSCQLIRRIEIVAPGAPWLVALHADGGDVDALAAHCREGVPFASLCCVQAPFSRNAFLGSGHAAALPFAGAYAGYAWFRRDLDGRPEPVSFADSVAQVELLIGELRALDRAPVFLLGAGAGAAIALAVGEAARTADGVIVVGAAGDPAVSTRAPNVLYVDTVTPAIGEWLRARREASHGIG